MSVTVRYGPDASTQTYYHGAAAVAGGMARADLASDLFSTPIMGDHIADLEEELYGHRRREKRDGFKKKFKEELTEWVRDIIENYEGFAGEMTSWEFDTKDILRSLQLVDEPFTTQLAGNIKFEILASEDPEFFIRIKGRAAKARRKEARDFDETQWAIKYNGRNKKRVFLDYRGVSL